MTMVHETPYADVSKPVERPRVLPAYVAHPHLETALNIALRLIQRSGFTDKAIGMRLAGPPSSGKTTVAQELLARYPATRIDGVLVSEVVYVMVREKGKLSSLFEDLLAALGDPLPMLGTQDAKRARLGKLLRAAGVRLVILDEPHHFTDERAQSIWVAVMQFMKFLQQWGISVMLMGVKALDRQVTISDEIERRFRVGYCLADYDIGNSAELAQLRDFCVRVGRSLTGLPPIELVGPEWYLPLYAGSRGRAGIIAEIVEEAVLVALGAGTTKVGREHFVQAWDEVFASSKESNLAYLRKGDSDVLRNPFSMNEKEVKLVVSGLITPAKKGRR